nr:hypothetical protein [Chelativorans sp. YIM 93263]
MQKNLRMNHLAVVTMARGGSQLKSVMKSRKEPGL